ncbi:TPA: hypothetical protein ACN1JE_005515, partial [Klebsiella pneumoniae]
QKPQKTHNLQPVKTIPLFAVRYLQPHQPPDAQQVKPHVRSRIPEATADSLCAAGEYNPVVRRLIPEATADSLCAAGEYNPVVRNRIPEATADS